MKRYIKCENNMSDWEPQDIELYNSIDWKARNYEEYMVPEPEFKMYASLYTVDDGQHMIYVPFYKFIRPNGDVYPPYYAPKSNPFDYPKFQGEGGVVGPMFDGVYHHNYQVHDRYETYELYDYTTD